MAREPSLICTIQKMQLDPVSRALHYDERRVAKKKIKKYDVPTEIRRLARERVGAVPSPKLIVPKKQRKKPKHKKPPGEEAN